MMRHNAITPKLRAQVDQSITPCVGETERLS